MISVVLILLAGLMPAAVVVALAVVAALAAAALLLNWVEDVLLNWMLWMSMEVKLALKMMGVWEEAERCVDQHYWQR
jgi:hypothetical protein